MMEPRSLRDQLEDALNAAEESSRAAEAPVNDIHSRHEENVVDGAEARSEEPEAPEPEVESPAGEVVDGQKRLRDAAGRFVSKSEELPVSEAEEAPPAPQEVDEPVVPPSSWKKEHWPAFSRMDKATRDYILEREEQAWRGVSKYKADLEAMQPIAEVLQQHASTIAQNGLTPAQAVRYVMQAHAAIASAEPVKKVQLLAELARGYGVDMQNLSRAMNGEEPQIDSYAAMALEEARAVRAEVDRMRALESQRIEQQAAKEASQFIEQHPLARMVAEDMSRLLSTGICSDLADAYDKAVYMNPEARARVVAEQQRNESNKAAEAARRARTAAVSPRSASPAPAVQNRAHGDVRSAIEDAWATMENSRL